MDSGRHRTPADGAPSVLQPLRANDVENAVTLARLLLREVEGLGPLAESVKDKELCQHLCSPAGDDSSGVATGARHRHGRVVAGNTVLKLTLSDLESVHDEGDIHDVTRVQRF